MKSGHTVLQCPKTKLHLHGEMLQSMLRIMIDNQTQNSKFDKSDVSLFILEICFLTAGFFHICL